MRKIKKGRKEEEPRGGGNRVIRVGAMDYKINEKLADRADKGFMNNVL